MYVSAKTADLPSNSPTPLTWSLENSSSFVFFFFFFFFLFFLVFLGLFLWHREVPRLGVKSDLQLLLAYTTITAMQHLSHVCHLHHSSRQCPRSLTHRARPGIEPASSWLPDSFVSTAWEGF